MAVNVLRFDYIRTNTKALFYICLLYILLLWAWGGVVVKALRY